ncbi:hypothetical protein AVEN_57885-1 [Araneus ventricosus]|uniref:Uncharacterized protein n=1 Tax=Araneus ventricosus TaxID=182803 RepID=A0A4Y2IU35_ARAVE|nr:hypothetical protein AVEN_145770-1 [Araneus ventricosus]GBO23373.1 hypothetical protein AVEN_57885-1 [Araneus ventricosus]
MSFAHDILSVETTFFKVKEAIFKNSWSSVTAFNVPTPTVFKEMFHPGRQFQGGRHPLLDAYLSDFLLGYYLLSHGEKIKAFRSNKAPNDKWGMFLGNSFCSRPLANNDTPSPSVWSLTGAVL